MNRISAARLLTLVPIAALAIGMLSACTSSATAGKDQGTTATFNKTTGNLSATVDRPLDDAFEAARKAMDDMGYKTQRADKDALRGIIEAREADNSLVKTELNRKADRIVDITINVGVFGDEAKARMILDKVLARLGR